MECDQEKSDGDQRSTLGGVSGSSPPVRTSWRYRGGGLSFTPPPPARLRDLEQSERARLLIQPLALLLLDQPSACLQQVLAAVVCEGFTGGQRIDFDRVGSPVAHVPDEPLDKADPALRPISHRRERLQGRVATGIAHQPDGSPFSNGIAAPQFGTPDEPPTKEEQRRRGRRLGVICVDVTEGSLLAELTCGPPEAPMQQGELDGVLPEFRNDAVLGLRHADEDHQLVELVLQLPAHIKGGGRESGLYLIA